MLDLQFLTPLHQLLARVIAFLERNRVGATQRLHTLDPRLEIGQHGLDRGNRCTSRFALGLAIGTLAPQLADTIQIRVPLALHQYSCTRQGFCWDIGHRPDLRSRGFSIHAVPALGVGLQQCLQTFTCGVCSREPPLEVTDVRGYGRIIKAKQRLIARYALAFFHRDSADRTTYRRLNRLHP